MKFAQWFANQLLVAGMIVTLASSTAHAQTKRNSEAPPPSVLGGAKTTVLIYNYTGETVKAFWVTPGNQLQSSPGAKPIPPIAGNTPYPLPTYNGTTLVFKKQSGGGKWIHLPIDNKKSTSSVVLGTPPKGASLSGPNANTPADQSGGGGGESPRKVSPEVAEFMKIHNAARAEVKVAPLTWSDDLARTAQDWADKLARTGKFEHRPQSPYGENIAWGTGNFTPASAANFWLAEKAHYSPNEAPRTQGAGRAAGRDENVPTGHYTQMVWSKTTMVGFGIAKTTNGTTIVVANYNPPGNVAGEKPY
jgi:uncharacterized protein YkwD